MIRQILVQPVDHAHGGFSLWWRAAGASRWTDLRTRVGLGLRDQIPLGDIMFAVAIEADVASRVVIQLCRVIAPSELSVDEAEALALERVTAVETACRARNARDHWYALRR